MESQRFYQYFTLGSFVLKPIEYIEERSIGVCQSRIRFPFYYGVPNEQKLSKNISQNISLWTNFLPPKYHFHSMEKYSYMKKNNVQFFYCPYKHFIQWFFKFIQRSCAFYWICHLLFNDFLVFIEWIWISIQWFFIE